MQMPQAVGKLIQTIREIGYGEMYGVELNMATPETIMDVSHNERDMVRFILDGNPYLDVLTIHDSQPVYAEQDFASRGFRCRKKTKFPTA